MEIILVDCSQSDTLPVAGTDHPSVRVLRIAPKPPTGWVRAEAVRAARAPLVAFLEEHAWAYPGWAAGFVSAFEGSAWAAIGAEMHSANDWAGINRYLAILNYPLLLAPVIVRPNNIVHHNAGYRRDLLLAYGDRLDELFFPEDWLQMQLLADGHQFITSPQVRVFHFFETTFAQSFNFNLIAGQIAEAACNKFYQRTKFRRLLRLGALCFSPILRPFKQLLFFIQHRPGWLGTFFSGIFVITLIHTAHAVGGIVGVLFGMSEATSIDFLQIDIGPTANLLCDRVAFEAVGGFKPNLMLSDTLISWAWTAAGIPLTFIPEAVVEHHHVGSWRDLLDERWQRGQEFGRLRIEYERWSTARLGWQVMVTLLPLRLIGLLRRGAANAWQAKQLSKYCLTLPVVAAGQWAWLLGELAAYLHYLRTQRILMSSGLTV